MPQQHLLKGVYRMNRSLKIFILSLVVLLGVASVALAQEKKTTGFVEAVAISKSLDTNSQMNALMVTPLSKEGWAIELWLLKADSWSEALVGVSKSVKPWLTLSSSVGVEDHASLWRTSHYVWVGNDKMSGIIIVEAGASGWWYKGVAKREIIPGASLGIYSQRFLGTGLYSEVKLSSKVTFWVAPILILEGRGNITGGLKFGF